MRFNLFVLMKIYTFLILVSLILYVQNSCDTFDQAKNKEECFNSELSEFEKQDNYTRCCYVQYKYSGHTLSECEPLNEDEYHDIDNYIKKVEDKYHMTVKKLDCESSYLKLGALALILLLF